MPESKIVLITGANKGIGFETARQLAKRGWHVVIGARKASAGQTAAKAIKQASGSASFLDIDVSNSESIGRAAAEFQKQFDHLDVLINNAGIYPDEGLTILTISRQQLTETFQTNTFGPVAVTVMSAGTVRDGAVVSTTRTTNWPVALLPALSVALQSTVVAPSARRRSSACCDHTARRAGSA